jgi:hypothetical protein
LLWREIAPEEKSNYKYEIPNSKFDTNGKNEDLKKLQSFGAFSNM